MKPESIQNFPNPESIYDFVKLFQNQQIFLLKEKGLLLDLDSDKDSFTKIYFLKGFFVEEIICKKTKDILFILPYKQGYRIDAYPKLKNLLLTEKMLHSLDIPITSNSYTGNISRKQEEK